MNVVYVVTRRDVVNEEFDVVKVFRRLDAANLYLDSIAPDEQALMYVHEFTVEGNW